MSESEHDVTSSLFELCRDISGVCSEVEEWDPSRSLFSEDSNTDEDINDSSTFEEWDCSRDLFSDDEQISTDGFSMDEDVVDKQSESEWDCSRSLFSSQSGGIENMDVDKDDDDDDDAISD